MNIVICGVGGQGILKTGELISICAMLSNFDVKKSEVHGMAQRGGSVITFVRFSHKVYSPTVPMGEGDILLSFEMLEALRYLKYLKKEGIGISSSMKIKPADSSYPENIERDLQKRGFVIVDCKSIKDMRFLNTYMTGFVSPLLPFEENIWLSSIGKVFTKSIEENKNIFLKGRRDGDSLYRR
ncbi:MAG: indolepyruvate oxidoreductase subunit beta [Deltaproteobacteria bacterium]|nr:indolepyruvate oxidoreductase subunit beta [Deltaproteobacteria bacterium]